MMQFVQKTMQTTQTSIRTRWRTGHIMTSELTWHICGDWTSNPKVLTQQHTQCPARPTHNKIFNYTIYYYIYIQHPRFIQRRISHFLLLRSTYINIYLVYKTRHYENATKVDTRRRLPTFEVRNWSFLYLLKNWVSDLIITITYLL